MVSEPARGLFWSNSLISLIDPNIYAFPCCSANIVRTRGFITSPKETSQDAPDESPQRSASSFSLLSPLIPLLSAAFSSSSSSLSAASPWERNLWVYWDFILAVLEDAPTSHPAGEPGDALWSTGACAGFRFRCRMAGWDQPAAPGVQECPWVPQSSVLGGNTAGRSRGMEQSYPNVPLHPKQAGMRFSPACNFPRSGIKGQHRLCSMESSLMDGQESAPGCPQGVPDPPLDISNPPSQSSGFSTAFSRHSHHFCRHL